LKIEREVKNLVEWNEENPSKSKYETKKIIEFNDIMRENLDPWNCWIDDMAKPNDKFSARDWAWRKVYSMDVAEEEFGKWPNWKYVKPGGVTTDKLEQSQKTSKYYSSKDLVEVIFYENRIKDMFWVTLGGVPVVMGPLPISDAKGNKKLSLWQSYWNLRHAGSPYGVGIYEAMRNNQYLLDRINNMSIDQLTLSIYKMFFYQGTSSLTETGDIVVSPGIGKQTLDPKNISWLDTPGPGKDAWEGMDHFRKDVDEASGITDPLLGQITGKTAFEIAQAKESALKRLKSPLENILDALDEEGYTTVALIQLLYSIPETYKIADPELIEDYLKEIDGDKELSDLRSAAKDTVAGYVPFMGSVKYKSMPPVVEFGRDVLSATFGNGKDQTTAINKLSEQWIYNILLPYGGNQVRKTLQGVQKTAGIDLPFVKNTSDKFDVEYPKQESRFSAPVGASTPNKLGIQKPSRMHLSQQRHNLHKTNSNPR